MKGKIHPRYHDVVFRDTSTGSAFLAKSTMDSKEIITWEDGKEYPLINVEISSESHPAYTGKQRKIISEGQVQKFREKYRKK